MNQQLQTLVDLFTSLSDATRLNLLQHIASGEVSVGYLSEQLGVSQPKVSRHLANLRVAGLVTTRRNGKQEFYSAALLNDSVANAILDLVVGRKLNEGYKEKSVEPNIYDTGDTMPYVPQEIEIYLL